MPLGTTVSPSALGFGDPVGGSGGFGWDLPILVWPRSEQSQRGDAWGGKGGVCILAHEDHFPGK